MFSQLGFTHVRAWPVLVPHWEHGDASLQVLAPYPAPIPSIVLGGSVGTSDQGVRATLLAVRDIAALRALPAEAVKGHIVFFTNRMGRTRDGSGYGMAVRQRTAGPSAAAALGAVGVVIRSIGTSNDRLPHTGITMYTSATTRIPARANTNSDADTLERQLATGKPVEVLMRLTSRDLPQVTSTYVIADIPGTDKPDEIFLLGAHLDSWDPGVGALDDGAGVAIVMAAAAQLARFTPKPRRTIRVVLFANEEFGLSGARAYAADPANAPDKHVLAMEADLGAGPVWRLDATVPAASWPLVQRMQRVLQPLGVSLGKNGLGEGSDLGPLEQLGVPMLSPELDASLYFDVHHSANDTLDKVDPKSLSQSVASFAVAAYLAAQEPGEIGRLPPGTKPRY